MPTTQEDIRLTIWFIVLFTGMLVLCFLFFVLLYQRRQKNMLIKKQELETKFSQTLLQAQIEIQEQTLTNISQELHDNIGQTLSVAKLNLSTIRIENLGESLQKIDASKQLITQALANIRDLAKSMLGEKIAEIGLKQAVQNELKILGHSGLYKISFSTDKTVANISSRHELIAFRIIQEAINNIVKHAEATKIDVEIKNVSRQTYITITDNGKGFNAGGLGANVSGIGLKNMRNRASLINAELQINSAVLAGTTTTLILND